LEDAARREFSEEVIGPSIEHKLQYLCSVSVADWRSEGCEDVKYMTTLFATWYTWGGIKAGDDLHEVAWFNPWKVDIIETHDPLLQRLKEAIYNGEIKG
jgi:8-oxo-dGTP pyrophosphatase MutT (NUDIX family)